MPSLVYDDGDGGVKPERDGVMSRRCGPSRWLSGVAALCFRRKTGDDEDCFQKVSRNYRGVYRYTTLAIWLATSAIMILDRFYWNVWPRQSICTDGCGTDFFCEMDEDPGCLHPGPWSVKVFDVFARISARLIISTTTLLFGTMCHGSWNWLSEVEAFRPFLYGWRGDNFWLHTVGGISIGIWVILHVWSLLLPSMVHGYKNVEVPGEFGWLPPQVPIPGGNLDAENREARWGVDDIWRIFWMTVMFGMLMPLSRSAWALSKNFSLAMLLHTAVGAGFFIDSARRKTHPHVWILNAPVVLWYIFDKIWCATKGRVDPHAQATRVQLDDDYMLLLWRHDDQPKRICDVFWMKKSHVRYGKGKGRAGELAHPFTTCSSHAVDIKGGARVSPFSEKEVDMKTVNARPMIEVPVRTDVSWPGHRFSLNSSVSSVRRDLESARGPKASGFGLPNGRTRELRPVDKGGVNKDDALLESATPASLSLHPFFPPTPGSALNTGRGLGLTWSEQGGSLVEEEKFGDQEETMIGAESGCRPGEVAFVIGSVRSCDMSTGRSIVASSVKRFFTEGEGELESQRENSHESGGGSGKDTEASGTTPPASSDDSLGEEDNNAVSALPPSHPHPRPSVPKTATMFTSPMIDAARHSRRISRTNVNERAARIGPPGKTATESPGRTPRSLGKTATESIGEETESSTGGKTESTGKKKAESNEGDSGLPGRKTELTGQRTELAGERTELAGQQTEPTGERTVAAIALTMTPVVTATKTEGVIPAKQVEPIHNIKVGTGEDDTAATNAAAGGEKKKMGLKRLETPMFQAYRKMEAMDEEEGAGGRGGRVAGGDWNKMAIVRIHRRHKEPTVRECTCMGYTHVMSSFRRPETSSIADIEIDEEGGTLPLRTYGPYRSDYGRLAEFPNLPPLLIIATGAGAALALDFVAYVRANRLVSKRPVKVCYSSASLALLQFVTNTLLAESTPGISIKTALTRHDDLELFDTTTEPKEDLAIGRLNVKAIVKEVSDDTEVYFCGGGTINAMLQKECSRRGMAYAGSAVQ